MTRAQNRLSDVESLFKSSQRSKIFSDLDQHHAYGVESSRRLGRIVVAETVPLQHQAFVIVLEGVPVSAALGLERALFVEPIGFVQFLLGFVQFLLLVGLGYLPRDPSEWVF